MKKMTKILSLVLALAMVLGMTAMAAVEVPSQLLLSDDFSDVADLSFDTFKATRTAFTATNFDTDTADTIFGNSVATKFYYAPTEPTFVNENGKIKLVSAKNSNLQLAYRLPETWSYTDNVGDVIVMSANIIPTTTTATGSSQVLMKALYKKKTDDAENTEGTYKGYAVNEDGTPKLTDGVGSGGIDFRYSQLTPSGYNLHMGTGNLFSNFVWEYNKPLNLSVVLNPRNHFGTAQTYLLHYLIANYSNKYGKSVNATHRVEEVQGFKIITSDTLDTTYNDVKMYAISGKGANLYIDTDNTKVSNIARDGSFEILFSQPLTEYYIANNSNNIDWALRNQIEISDGTDTLTYADGDFTVGVSERIIGNAVKGVVTITPAVDLDYDTTYTVSFGKVRNIAYIQSSAAQSIDITTEAAPSYTISLTAAEGLTTGTAINTAADLAGKTVYFTAEAEKTAGNAVGGVVVIGIYDEGGNLVKLAAANKAFDEVGAKNTFSAAFKVAAGQTAKAFVKGTASTVTFGE